MGSQAVRKVPRRKEQDRDRAWSSRESTALKRDALLDCLDTARDCYRHAWARTSVDIAIQVILCKYQKKVLCQASSAGALEPQSRHQVHACGTKQLIRDGILSSHTKGAV